MEITPPMIKPIVSHNNHSPKDEPKILNERGLKSFTRTS